MKKYFILSVIALVMSFTLSAQSQVEKTNSYESFSTVEVSDNFTVRLIGSDSYSVRLKADERVAPYVQSYVQHGTLYVSVDKKSFTPELKKELKGKSLKGIMMEAEIYAPTLTSLSLNGKTSLVQSDTIRIDSFTLSMSDDARIEKLILKCNRADISLSKSAYANIIAEVTDRLIVSAANSAEAIIDHKGGNNLTVNATGYSHVRATMNVPEFTVSTSSGADLLCIGDVQQMVLKAAGTSSVQAESLNVTEASVEQTGSSKCYMNVSDKIQVNLTGGSMMTFTQAPVIDIVRVVNSTLIKADDPKRK